jgi:hypothetical protein
VAARSSIGETAAMDSSLPESLSRRLARLRVQVARTQRDADDARARAREITESTSASRHARWTLRYERTLEKKTNEIGDLKL